MHMTKTCKTRSACCKHPDRRCVPDYAARDCPTVTLLTNHSASIILSTNATTPPKSPALPQRHNTNLWAYPKQGRGCMRLDVWTALVAFSVLPQGTLSEFAVAARCQERSLGAGVFPVWPSGPSSSSYRGSSNGDVAAIAMDRNIAEPHGEPLSCYHGGHSMVQ